MSPLASMGFVRSESAVAASAIVASLRPQDLGMKSHRAASPPASGMTNAATTRLPSPASTL